MEIAKEQNLQWMPYDAEVEYLDIKNSAMTFGDFVDTAIWWVKADVMILPGHSKNGVLFGTTDKAMTVPSFCQFLPCYDATSSILDWPLGNRSQPSALLPSLKYSVEIRNGRIVLNDYIASFGYKSVSNQAFCIGGRAYNSSLTGGCSVRLYNNIKIWNGNKLTYDVKTVRKGKMGYLYDTISNRLFDWHLLGEIQLGPDV